MTEQIRAAFEAWYAQKFAGGSVANMPRRSNGEYVSNQAQIAWMSFQEAARRQHGSAAPDDIATLRSLARSFDASGIASRADADAIAAIADRLSGSAAQGVPAFDHGTDCDPTVTRCPRCKNPHHSCDRGSAASAVETALNDLADEAHANGNAWRPMDDAPKDRDILLVTRYGLVYVGRYRYGNFGEPQQDVLAWRCSSSGRYAEPTFWMDVPPIPAQNSFLGRR